MNTSSFRVIIVGGSVAGLTLAHGLQKAGIDYVVLEKQINIAHDVGAGLSIMPNGGRILQQLGIWHLIEGHAVAVDQTYIFYPDGFSFKVELPSVVHQRFGYPIAILDRAQLVKTLYSSLPGPTRVQCGKKVVRIELDDRDISIVYTEDGDSYEGNVVVGADGVHSRVRTEMWKDAKKPRPMHLGIKERVCNHGEGMTIEYACVFGKSAPLEELNVGEHINVVGHGEGLYIIHGKDCLFWFLFIKLPKKYVYPDAPCFSPDDVSAVSLRFSKMRIKDEVYFRDIWDNRMCATLVPLEEGLFQPWQCGNIVCIGDSMHKVAPHFGQGANLAIEDAATLTNILHSYIMGCKGKPMSKDSVKTLQNLLKEFTRTRLGRIKDIDRMSRFTARFQASDGILMTYFGRYILPHLTRLSIDIVSKSIANSVILDFADLPMKEAPGWLQFRGKSTFMSSQQALVALFTFSLVAILVCRMIFVN